MNGYLLDTHTALWWWTEFPRLGANARELLEETEEPIAVSAASAFEISLKWRLGKLAMLGDPRISYEPLMKRNGFSELQVTNDHAIRAGTLDGAHRDPFDRLIAAQALTNDLTVVTRDREIAAFGCKVLW
ncbi:type II toxin-antitoxin system VapC family toxin [uncultured Sphingomonas sp.]|uniref:type II toxin-antitoxin system VapC family toxin n=1 Tax=uncultured Sphingomonas sp. TaxID=158754 RepID=UPI0035C9CE79